MVFVVTQTPKERFWPKVDVKSRAECWEWTASRSPNGYGQFSLQGKRTGAHRFAYESVNGPVSPALVLDHLCRNKGCVNPEHLEAVTHWENLRRGVGGPALNYYKTHCDSGHIFDGDNTYITKKGRRSCRICHRRWSAKWRDEHA